MEDLADDVEVKTHETKEAEKTREESEKSRQAPLPKFFIQQNRYS